jgi:CheY-like chemotaxis protein
MWLVPDDAPRQEEAAGSLRELLPAETAGQWEPRIAPEELALNLQKLQLAREAARMRPPGPRAATMLVVHDDPDFRKSVREWLRSTGATVLEAADGETGLRMAHAYDGPIHLLITGVALKGMNGVELEAPVAFLRPGIRVLFITGAGEERTIPLPTGRACLQKPFSPAELKERVRELLS